VNIGWGSFFGGMVVGMVGVPLVFLGVAMVAENRLRMRKMRGGNVDSFLRPGDVIRPDIRPIPNPESPGRETT
jgi:hypothetical protein